MTDGPQVNGNASAESVDWVFRVLIDKKAAESQVPVLKFAPVLSVARCSGTCARRPSHLEISIAYNCPIKVHNHEREKAIHSFASEHRSIMVDSRKRKLPGFGSERRVRARAEPEPDLDDFEDETRSGSAPSEDEVEVDGDGDGDGDEIESGSGFESDGEVDAEKHASRAPLLDITHSC